MSRAPRVGPPAIARVLVRLLATSEDRDLLSADLDERFEAIRERHGAAAARRWYWSQAVRGLGAALRPDPGAFGARSWSGTGGDVRQAARVLVRHPLYTVGVAGTLTVGLASAAVVASVVWHVWLAPMPFPDPERVVRLFELEPPEDAAAEVAGAGERPSDARRPSDGDGGDGGDSADGGDAARGAATAPERTRWRLSPPLLEDLRADDWASVQAVAGVSRNMLEWARDDDLTRLTSLVVSPEAFAILGIVPRVGRVISDDVDAPEVVLTRPFWRRAYGEDPGVVGGTTMTLGGVPHTIVGVVDLPAGYPGAADVLTRMSYAPDELNEGMRGARYLDVIARVAPGSSVADAASEMDRRIEALGAVHANHAGWGGDAAVLGDELLAPYRGALALLGVAGALFLLLAVVNVAGLVAARTMETRQDRAVRLALGASERRLLRSALVESVLLGTLAACAALAAAGVLVEPVRALVPADVPRVEEIALSAGLSLAIVLLALASGAIVGALGYFLSRGGPSATARAGRTVTDGMRGRGWIVVSQVALTTLLATAGAGILRHVVSLQRVDLGFEPAGVVSAQAMLAGPRYPTAESRLLVWRDLLDRMDGRGLEAAIGTSPPMAGVNMPWGYRRDAAADQGFAQYHIVSQGYFGIMGVELIDGRTFTDEDREGAPPVIVVNEGLAEALFPGERAVGRRITVVADTKEIVGVVRATRHFGPSEPAPEEIYAPYGQDPWPHAQVLVRGEPDRVAPLVATAAEEADPTLALPPVAPYGRFVTDWFAALRLQLLIVGVMALVGTGLATLGLYALVAYRVSARRREIGVRMALGASGGRMFSDVVRQGVGLAGVGVVVGVVVWFAATPAVRRLLGDIDVSDPAVAVAVALGVALVSAFASAVPARRSVRVDPVVTLRAD